MDNGRRGVRLTLGVVAVIAVLALAWIGFTTAWLWRYQERVVFQPPAGAPDAPPPARRVSFAASDGHALFGYVVSPDAQHRTPRTVVIAFHGNADLAVWQIPWAQEVVERTGAVVLIPEYRGYAGIPGTPTYETAAADARGALTFARTLGGSDGGGIVLYGHSLGTAIVAELAREMRDRPPKALLLVSPFTSARDMATRMLVPTIPWVWRRISRVHYDTRAVVAGVASPVHVAHGSRDLNIPVRMGRQVHASARHAGDLLIVEGAGHNDVIDVAGERYWEWLRRGVGASAPTSGR
jgi:fermentation-respiration switch protein FrsA (DUF1100 family)